VSERVPGSFRDPAGFVFRRGGGIYRQVNDSFVDTYQACVDSGLYQELQELGLLVEHRVVDQQPADASLGSLVLMPTQIPFVSYPYEWCPGQLRAAAELTLEIQRRALEKGFVLRDASAFNVQFHQGRQIFIDTLSFTPWVEGEPWVAYNQFCRHFLAPLALARHRDSRLTTFSRIDLDGIPLDLAAALLPWKTRLSFGLGVHVHAHARSQRRHAGDANHQASAQKQPKVSLQAMLGLTDSLLSAIRKQEWNPPKTAWRDYYEARESYSDSGLAHKEAVVREVLRTTGASSLWDFGANTGRFSRIAGEVTGAEVVAFEMDVSAVELNWREAAEGATPSVLPLLLDLSNPSPSQGWAHSERASLEARGPADVGLALALIHHLAIGNNVPLRSVASWFARVAKKVVIEWVPKDDPLVQRLLATREDVFDDYSTSGFESAFDEYFTIQDRFPLEESARSIYVMQAR